MVAPLLSRKACLGLNLVKCIYVENQKTDRHKEFPALSKGLGNMEVDYTIELKENPLPYIKPHQREL